MKKYSLGKRIRYWTANSWNLNDAPAYNLKIYNVIHDRELREKLYNILDYPEFWENIDYLIDDFRINTGWDAGFNGRSGGYLVLYNPDYPFRTVDEKDVDADTLRLFRKLANDIIRTAVYNAEHSKVEEVTYTATKNVLVIGD